MCAGSTDASACCGTIGVTSWSATNAASGADRLKRTVCASTFATALSGPQLNTASVCRCGLSSVVTVYTTSSAVIAVPSDHLASVRRGTLSVLPPSVYDGCALASEGPTLKSGCAAYSSGNSGVYARIDATSRATSGFSDAAGAGRLTKM